MNIKGYVSAAVVSSFLFSGCSSHDNNVSKKKFKKNTVKVTDKKDTECVTEKLAMDLFAILNTKDATNPNVEINNSITMDDLEKNPNFFITECNTTLNK